MEYFGFDRPSFGFKMFGFGGSQPSGPILSANFVTGEYQQNGVASTFDDSFDFNRAGKAWLVKEAGLIEYGIDVPRFDSGLLIEEGYTNAIIQSGDLSVSPWSTSSGTLQSNYSLSPGKMIDSGRFTKTADGFGVYQLSGVYEIKATDSLLFSVWLRSDDSAEVKFYLNGANSQENSNGNVVTITTTNEWVRYSGALNFVAEDGGYYFLVNAVTVGDDFEIWQPNAQLNKNISSIVPTTTTPVTRPADLLSANTTGTTVIGDWDETLSLSIVGGELTVSGYGYLRSLEIN